MGRLAHFVAKYFYAIWFFRISGLKILILIFSCSFWFACAIHRQQHKGMKERSWKPVRKISSFADGQKHLPTCRRYVQLKAGPPLEAILVTFGRRALIFFCLKDLGKK